MMARHYERADRLDRVSGASVRNWEQPPGPVAEQMASDCVVDMGWGRLIVGHTFESNEKLIETLCREGRGRRDIAWYLRDPHVLLALAPDRLFLDPSHTYRLWSHCYRASSGRPEGLVVRRIRTLGDGEAINRVYASRQMVLCDAGFMLDRNASRLRTYLVAESADTGQVIGTVTGVDHTEAFNDPENGASLWCLAVDPQSHVPAVGEWLVRHLVERFFARGRAFVDLSVMHDNELAIALYEKLGFARVPVFCIKNKNPINEPLFTTVPKEEEGLNPYAQIIVNEARRRGMTVEVIDAEAGYFSLQMGGRSVVCRESLSELTTAIAMSRCDDKRITRRVLAGAGLRVPDQRVAGGPRENVAFLDKHRRIVIKPARGEQGVGVRVDVRKDGVMRDAINEARLHCPEVILEEFIEGEDLRVVVIDFRVVAAAVRRLPVVVGAGGRTVEQLIRKYNRRRAAATGGESQVPLDAETRRCVEAGGFAMDSVPESGVAVTVRRTANLHTGGTIHDVTDRLHGGLAEAAVAAARAIDIPVVGLDLIVESVEGGEYVIIEANERPGLANHEPQPTAERFIDVLFPQSVGPGQS